MSKIANALNDAWREFIAQSDSGLPDDFSQPVEATEEDALCIRQKLEGTVDQNHKDDSDDLVRQLARPNHGTA